ncbi:hypothetical protein HZS_3620 [Henneguya salminicola]|nr:hypothetical protein HZS_3620 [Henneguya salminicola]
MGSNLSPHSKKQHSISINIEHWIKVCRELRELKNFSSLKSVISALSSHEIYHLQKEWDKKSY